ncbi:MAG: hypothetical protein NZ822_00390 [Patescibacteria group bacterium]|nr:hypothetical protein [Patescibacteria group bacterium]
MDQKKKIIIIGGIALLLIFIIIVLIGYFGSRNNKSTPFIERGSNEDKNIPTPILGEDDKRQDQKTNGDSKLVDITQQKSIFQPVINEAVFYLDLDYPNLYVYDYDDAVIKVINLEDETYQELYKVIDFQKAFLSPDKSKMVIRVDRLNLINIKDDKLYTLPGTTKNFVFTDKDLIIHYNDDKSISYLAYFREGKITKIRNLGILNAELNFLPPDKILIYQKRGTSPVFILNIKSPSFLSLFLEPAENYSLLVSQSNKDLIFVSNQNGSRIIDFKTRENRFNFDWRTVQEKCTFDRFLVCAVSNNFDFDNWYLMGENYDNKVVVFDPEKNEIVKEIEIEVKVDMIRPKLVNSKIIFWNRLDAGIYAMKID